MIQLTRIVWPVLFNPRESRTFAVLVNPDLITYVEAGEDGENATQLHFVGGDMIYVVESLTTVEERARR